MGASDQTVPVRVTGSTEAALDRQGLAVALQALQREHGVSPLGGFLPALLQIPVFLGLYHVLKSFNRTGSFNSTIGCDLLNVSRK